MRWVLIIRLDLLCFLLVFRCFLRLVNLFCFLLPPTSADFGESSLSVIGRGGGDGDGVGNIVDDDIRFSGVNNVDDDGMRFGECGGECGDEYSNDVDS